MTYIFYDNFSYSRYILDGIKNKPEVKLIEVPLPQGLKHKLLKWGERLSTCLYTPVAHDKNVRKALQEIRPQDTVILFDFWTYENVKYLLRHMKCDTVHLWFWNTLNDYIPRVFTLTAKNELLFHTFDPEDATRHHMFLHNQFYREAEPEERDNPELYDFFFVGQNKGRLDTLKRLNTKLRDWGYSTKFIIVDYNAEEEEKDGIEFRNKDVDYDETLRLMKQSKVLVDCTKSNQKGITLRVLEGLFLNKKVLSNNLEIKNLSFYDPSRIMFFDQLISEEAAREFMTTPLLPAAKEEKEPYDVNHWLKEISATHS